MMSWNKNTIIHSEIDNTIEILKENKIKYKLEVLGEVEGNGLNDDYVGNEDGAKKYPIRKLTYQSKVVLERMERYPDCDSDDILVSEKFEKGKEPKKWKIDVMIEEEE